MRRPRWFEWEDFGWLPRRWRDYLTELLRYQLGPVYAPAVPLLADWMRANGCSSVVDLFSGAGGPWPIVRPLLAARGVDATVLLTDKYPYRPGDAGGGEGIRYLATPLDATQLPDDIGDCVTLFTGFHHFGPADAVAFLREMAERRRPVAVFEFTERRWRTIVRMLPSPLLVWRDTPAVEPFRWGRLFWTYLVPVVPLLYLWDGVVSHLRSYPVVDLEAMTAEAARDDYVWKVGRNRIRVRCASDHVRAG